MAKLYPPFIESKLPAFAEVLEIPFEMNRSVSTQDVVGMSAIIKTAQTGRQIGVAVTTAPSYNANTGKYSAIFSNLSHLNLRAGQYYKVQLAYIGREIDPATGTYTVGYYSSAGIVKKTTKPTLSIPSLDSNLFYSYDYIGQYSQKGGDETEKVYSYRFDLSDEAGNVLDTSGEKLHDSSTDQESYLSIDSWKSNASLKKEVPYYLSYTITTNNGLVQTIQRQVVSADSVDIDIDISLESRLNYEDGTAQLYIMPKYDSPVSITGDFILTRSSSDNNFASWDEVYKLSYLNVAVTKDAPMLVWEDFSVKQGEEYLYALQAYNSNNLYSNRLETKNTALKIDFEHCYIGDAKRQLKLQFNPKISSFKNTLLESKIETMGSKYPFIFRNGTVNYREFPISGLLSLLSDPNEKFMSFDAWKMQEGRRASTPGFGESRKLGTDLNGENIYNERQFKMEVLDWLNNGEPKIFRSPTEGNFIVRIMNVSLSPNDTLGRMLHNFSCQAYEIDDWNFNNLLKHNLIDMPVSKKSTLTIGQVIPDKVFTYYLENNLNSKYPGIIYDPEQDENYIGFPECYNVNITGATMGTKFKLYFSSGDVVDIVLGGTGCYYVPIATAPKTTSNVFFQGIELVGDKKGWDGVQITFEQYNNTPSDTFSKISSLTMTEEIRRFVGPGYTKNLVKVNSTLEDYNTAGTVASGILADIRREIGVFHFIKVEKRYIQQMWRIPGTKQYSRNASLNDIIKDDEWNTVTIYHDNTSGKFYDGGLNKEMVGKPDFRFCLNNQETVFSDFGGYAADGQYDIKYGNTFGSLYLTNINKVEELRAGNGLLVDVAYRVRIKEYNIEDGSVTVQKNSWLQSKTNLLECLQGIQYSTIKLTNSTYKPNEYYYYDAGQSTYYISRDSVFNPNLTYYQRRDKVMPTEERINSLTGQVNQAYANYVIALIRALK